MLMFKAVVFDFDGTLVDSVGSIATALNQLLAEEGHPAVPNDAVATMVGDGAIKLIERGFAASGDPIGSDAASRLMPRYEPMLVANPPGAESVYPGVRATLEALHRVGVRLGVCTNKPERPARVALDAVGLADLIDVVIGGDTTPVRKPAAEPLLTALDALGATPADSAMVGDNANDVAAARAAGLPVIVVSYGYPRGPSADLGADLVIDDFAELPRALHRLRLGSPERPVAAS